MSLRMWMARITALFRTQTLEDELEKDIREHLEMATEENIRRGMTPRQAADAARRSFGGVDRMKEEYRDQRGVPVWDALSRETRFALRSLRKAPAFTALTVLTLAFAIGANATIFGAINTLLLHPPGISEPERVVVIRSRYEKLHLGSLVVSLRDFKQISESDQIFSAAGIAKTTNFTYTGGEYPQRLAALRVSWRLFEALGQTAAQGRVFAAHDDTPGNDHEVVLSDAAWRHIFGGDPAIVGKSVRLDQQLYTIIGVMRPETTIGVNELGRISGKPFDIFVPLAAHADSPPVEYTETYLCIARLQPNVSLAKAKAFMAVLTRRGFKDPIAGRPREENGWGLFLLPYTEYSGGDLSTPLVILWGAVALVLLIASANIAGLMLARMSARSRELAVRSALGASRWHLFRLILIESLILALAASCFGLGVGYASVRGVEAASPASVTGALHIPFNPSIIAFTLGAGILSSLLFGTAVATQVARDNRIDALRKNGRSGSAGPEKARFRTALVTAELAMAVVLSIGAGLLFRSLWSLRRVDVGFRADGAMSAVITLPESRYKDTSSMSTFYREVINRLAHLPGVEAAAAGYPIPFGGGFEERAFEIVGRSSADGRVLTAQIRVTTPDFFRALGVPLIRGRVFTDQDTDRTGKVMLIDEFMARRFWGSEDPVGKRVVLRSGLQATIVGVVGHTKQSDLTSDTDNGVFYYSLYQQPFPLATLIIRSNAGPVPVNAIRQSVSSVEPSQSVYDVESMQDRVETTLGPRKFTVALLAIFAVTAVFLAALGLYGVVNYSVTQRTQEIGIRMALGARPGQVLSLILKSGLRVSVAGLITGCACAFGIARLIADQMAGLRAFDPVTFAAMAAIMSAVTLLASYVPARRATKLDPLEACRQE